MIKDILKEAIEALKTGSDTPELDARVLLSHAMGKNPGFLYAWPERQVPAEEYRRFKALLEKRRAGVPIAQLVGSREFWSMDLKVTEDTLIPRPETERVVEIALEHIPPFAKWRVLDLGTGSGAIALAIARERPDCRVVATDIDNGALNIAQRNAAHYKLRNIEFLLGDWFTPLADQHFQCIVANPPYVRMDDPHLSAGDVRFEPEQALVSGADGLDAIRAIAGAAAAHLEPAGVLILEHGWDQKSEVAVILEEGGFREITCYCDLAGKDRVTRATRHK